MCVYINVLKFEDLRLTPLLENVIDTSFKTTYLIFILGNVSSVS